MALLTMAPGHDARDVVLLGARLTKHGWCAARYTENTSPNLFLIALDHRRPPNFVVAVDPPTDRNPDYTGSRWAPPCSVRSPTETETTLVRGCAGWAGECGCGRACGRRFESASRRGACVGCVGGGGAYVQCPEVVSCGVGLQLLASTVYTLNLNCAKHRSPGNGKAS